MLSLRLFVALATLIVAFVTGTGVAEAQSGAAAITSDSGRAVGAVGDVTPGRVGFEGLLIDDGVLGCCVAPDVSVRAPGYPMGAAAEACAGIGARTTAALIDGQGFGSALGEGFDGGEIVRDAAGGLAGGLTFRVMGGRNPATSTGQRAVIGGASFAAEGAVVNGVATYAAGGSITDVIGSTGRGGTQGGLLGVGVSFFDKPSAPRRTTNAPRSAPGTAIRPVGRHLESVDDVFANPHLLIDDVADPSRVRTILEGTPSWEAGTMRHGSSAGEGWTFRELNAAGTDFTDPYIQ